LFYTSPSVEYGPQKEKIGPTALFVLPSTFTEEQITYALNQVESGKPVGDVCRQLGVSEQSFYRWKRKYQGIGIAELRRLRQLEDENRKLKKIVADLSLDKHILQDVLSKKF
jgi:putative transposase